MSPENQTRRWALPDLTDLTDLTGTLLKLGAHPVGGRCVWRGGHSSLVTSWWEGVLLAPTSTPGASRAAGACSTSVGLAKLPTLQPCGAGPSL